MFDFKQIQRKLFNSEVIKVSLANIYMHVKKELEMKNICFQELLFLLLNDYNQYYDKFYLPNCLQILVMVDDD